MTREEFNLALNWLREQDPPLALPFGMTPGEEPGGNAPTFTAETWDLYQWNPPGPLPVPEGAFDESASPKPTWAMIQAALAPAQLAQARAAALSELDDICQRKIIAAYGATSMDKEILLRLRNGETPAQNTERDRLRGLHETQEAAINAAPTPAAVETLIVAARADAFWAPPAD